MHAWDKNFSGDQKETETHMNTTRELKIKSLFA